MRRLFVALPVPPDVDAALAASRADIPGARWLGPGGLHLTLRFIGEVDEERAEQVRWALARVRFPNPHMLLPSAWARDPTQAWPRLRLVRRGAFPNARRAHALVALIEGDHRTDPRLGTLHWLVGGALAAAAGIPREQRPFRPHVTLARLRGFAEAGAWVSEPLPDGLAFVPDAFVLYESTLTPTGAVHTALARYPFVSRP